MRRWRIQELLTVTPIMEFVKRNSRGAKISIDFGCNSINAQLVYLGVA